MFDNFFFFFSSLNLVSLFNTFFMSESETCGVTRVGSTPWFKKIPKKVVFFAGTASRENFDM
jgi:hypothetical protein